MATTTTVSANYTAGALQITVTAFTNPALIGMTPKTILQFPATGEQMLVTDTTLAPTLGVVPGWNGTPCVAHKIGEAVVYGLANDTALQSAPQIDVTYPIVTTPTLTQNSADVTATGATGSTAYNVAIAGAGLLTVTGASGAGINLPYATPGAEYTIKNMMTGDLKIYAVGSSINGTTGTTAVTLTTTGNKTIVAFCTVAGAWQAVLNT